jgi:hypothetical protein
MKQTEVDVLITRAACTALFSSVLCGCATAPSVPVRVPVPVECRVATPARPAMPTDSLTFADSLERKVKAALAELEIREGYELELLAALGICTAPLERP